MARHSMCTYLLPLEESGVRRSPRRKCSAGSITWLAWGAPSSLSAGGEPILHPDLEAIVRAIRRKGIIATLITNGYLLTAARIRRLNRAEMDWAAIRTGCGYSQGLQFVLQFLGVVREGLGPHP